MKKSIIIAIISIVILLLLGGFYWLGYLSFEGYSPSFTLNPGESSSNTTAKNEGTPRLMVESIKGRINKISVVIKNSGDGTAEMVNWTIDVTGGILKRIDMTTTGSMSTLSSQSQTTVLSGRVPLGIGRVQITVTVECAGNEPITQTSHGFKFLFFIIGVRV
jgi:hypothetical protein